jgi:hypothetical protein
VSDVSTAYLLRQLEAVRKDAVEAWNGADDAIKRIDKLIASFTEPQARSEETDE